MNSTGFRKFLETTTYFENGKEINYTKKGIDTRVTKALKVEEKLKLNLDDYVGSYDKMVELLTKIRDAKIENLKHTPLSNAARHYYKYKNGKEFPRIF